jgi:hypothetical protein
MPELLHFWDFVKVQVGNIKPDNVKTAVMFSNRTPHHERVLAHRPNEPEARDYLTNEPFGCLAVLNLSYDIAVNDNRVGIIPMHDCVSDTFQDLNDFGAKMIAVEVKCALPKTSCNVLDAHVLGDFKRQQSMIERFRIEVPIINSRGDSDMPGGQCHAVPLASSVISVVTQSWEPG